MKLRLGCQLDYDVVAPTTLFLNVTSNLLMPEALVVRRVTRATPQLSMKLALSGLGLREPDRRAGGGHRCAA